MEQVEIKRIRQSTPYLVNKETGGIFGFYQVLVKFPDGTKKTFNSEEEANAFLEKRAVNTDSLEKEVPAGFRAAQAFKQRELGQNMPDNGEQVPDEPDEFDVVLTSFNDKKVAVIKIVRELTGLSLSESKEKVEAIPSVIFTQQAKEDAEKTRDKLVAAGATVELR